MVELKLLNGFSWKRGFLTHKQQWKTTIHDLPSGKGKELRTKQCADVISLHSPYPQGVAMSTGTVPPKTSSKCAKQDIHKWLTGLHISYDLYRWVRNKQRGKCIQPVSATKSQKDTNAQWWWSPLCFTNPRATPKPQAPNPAKGTASFQCSMQHHDLEINWKLGISQHITMHDNGTLQNAPSIRELWPKWQPPHSAKCKGTNAPTCRMKPLQQRRRQTTPHQAHA